MTQHTITLPHGIMLLNEVSEKAKNVKLHTDVVGSWIIGYDVIKSIPPGNWQLLGITPLIEEQAARVVERIHVEIAPNPANDMGGSYDYAYVDYERRGDYAGWGGDAGAYRKAIESFHSLLTDNGVDVSKRWAVLFENKN